MTMTIELDNMSAGRKGAPSFLNTRGERLARPSFNGVSRNTRQPNSSDHEQFNIAVNTFAEEAWV
jgi:hypothetical protein